MQRFVVSRRFGRDSELTSALSIPNTPTSSSKATRTHSRRSSTPIHLTSKTSENLSSYTTTSGLGLDSFVSLQFVTTPSPTTSYATLSTSSSVRPQPPATYFDTRLYPPPSSPVTEPQPLSTSTFNPPIVSVVLVSSGIALITLAICVLFYRCSCAAAHESENYHQNAKESPMFGGNGVNTEKYTIMGSLDSWESMQASLAHGMGRMPQVATPYTRQSLSPSSGTVTRIDGSTSRWNMVPGSGHSNDSIRPRDVGNARAGAADTRGYKLHSPLNYPAGQASAAGTPFTKSTYAPTRNVVATVNARGHTNWDSRVPSSAGAPPHTHPASGGPVLSGRTIAWKRPNVPVISENISRPTLQSSTSIAVQSTMSSPSATTRPLHSILKQSNSQPSSMSSNSFSNGQTKRRPMLQNEMQHSAEPRKGPSSSRPAQQPQRPTHGARLLNAPDLDSVPRGAQLPASASQSGSSSSLGDDSSGTEGQTLPRILDFPLPPDMSVPIASSSSMKLTSSDFRDKRRFSAASAAARGSRTLSGNNNGALANVGDLMMRGFGDSDVSGDETTDSEDSLAVASTAKRVVVPSKDIGATSVAVAPSGDGDSNSASRHCLPGVPAQEPAQNMASIPSIMITATSVDSLKALNRRISRAQMAAGNGNLKASNTRQGHGLPSSHSLPTSSSGRVVGPSGSRFDSDDSADESGHSTAGGLAKHPGNRDRDIVAPGSEWAPLSQMVYERAQPDYRSATFTIYNMYYNMPPDDDAGFVTPPLSMPVSGPVAPLELRGTKNKPKERRLERDVSDMSKDGHQATTETPNTATMSTIYAGYGLSEKDDIGASFAREVGASLGRIR